MNWPPQTDKEYFAHPAISASKINCFITSRAMYHDEYIAKAHNYRPVLDSMKFGSLLHAMAFNQPLDGFYVHEKVDRRTREGKALWPDIEFQAAGRVMIPEPMYSKVYDCMISLQAHPFMKSLMDRPHKVEYPLLFESLGMPCKAKLDYWAPDSGLIVDLKTCYDIDKFAQHFVSFGYHRSASFYLSAEPNACTFLFLVVESQPPWRVKVFCPDFNSLCIAEQEICYALSEMKRCEETGDWTDPDYEIEFLGLPSGYRTDRIRPQEVEF